VLTSRAEFHQASLKVVDARGADPDIRLVMEIPKDRGSRELVPFAD
jgi:hypothetical protein